MNWKSLLNIALLNMFGHYPLFLFANIIKQRVNIYSLCQMKRSTDAVTLIPSTYEMMDIGILNADFSKFVEFISFPLASLNQTILITFHPLNMQMDWQGMEMTRDRIANWCWLSHVRRICRFLVISSQKTIPRRSN